MMRGGDAHKERIRNEAVLAQLEPSAFTTLSAEWLCGAVLHTDDVIFTVDDADALLNRDVLDKDTASQGYRVEKSTDANVLDDARFASLRNLQSWTVLIVIDSS